jgi:hypothetical protein
MPFVRCGWPGQHYLRHGGPRAGAEVWCPATKGAARPGSVTEEEPRRCGRARSTRLESVCLPMPFRTVPLSGRASECHDRLCSQLRSLDRSSSSNKTEYAGIRRRTSMFDPRCLLCLPDVTSRCTPPASGSADARDHLPVGQPSWAGRPRPACRRGGSCLGTHGPGSTVRSHLSAADLARLAAAQQDRSASWPRKPLLADSQRTPRTW